MPGNLGLRDQISALQWIRANIRSFNGDPNSVTVAGDSAGAVSASILAISPLAKGLFHRIILKSGSALMHSAVRTLGTKHSTLKVLNAMSCRDVDCLKNFNKTALNKIYMDLLMDAAQDPYERLQGLMIFSPVIDDYMEGDSILPKHPLLLMKENAHLPALISTTSDERLGLFGALVGLKNTGDNIDFIQVTADSTEDWLNLSHYFPVRDYERHQMQ
uniref:Carboxylesterase type B domain-containing protein n=1 Tax=Romanomermis culicivorax TaxID=13658 RepID=A0A915I8A9_ROMCU